LRRCGEGGPHENGCIFEPADVRDRFGPVLSASRLPGAHQHDPEDCEKSARVIAKLDEILHEGVVSANDQKRESSSIKREG
jgi:hypothetical protein